MKKVLSVLLAVFMLIQGMCLTSFAEDVNNFPPVRPTVGNMTIAVSDEEAYTVAGLRTNGTIALNSPYVYEELKNEILSLNNIVDIDCTLYEVFALRSDGTVFGKVNNHYIRSDLNAYKELDVSAWYDIAAIECGNNHVVGLKSDGTVIASGSNNNGQCNVMGWNNVSKIYAHKNTTIAIKKDGTILATGEIKNYSELRKLKDVKEVFCNEYNEYYALLNDGTITAKEKVGVKDNKLAEPGSASEYVELSIDTILKMSGFTKKIISFKSGVELSPIPRYFFVDEVGDMYRIEFDVYKCSIEKIEEKITSFVLHRNDYYALDENGQIWSNAAAFTSDDWILTTNITYNGEKINSDVPPYVKEGRTLAPIRAILEALGMIVSWDGTTQTATAIKGDITISVTINSNIAIVNGVQKTLDVPAEITNGRTFVPVRFFAEALNMNVDWDGYTKTVIIESK